MTPIIISDAVKKLFHSAVTFEFDTKYGELEFIKIKIKKNVYAEMFDWLNLSYKYTISDPNNPCYKTEVQIVCPCFKHNFFEVYPAYFTCDRDNNIIAVFRVHSSR